MNKIKTTTGTEIELNDYQLKQYNLIMQAHGSVGLVRQKDKWLVYEPSKVKVVRQTSRRRTDFEVALNLNEDLLMPNMFDIRK